VPVDFPVRCQPAGSKEVGGQAANLSTGGIGLRTNSPIKTKEQITVEFMLPGVLSPSNLRGAVVWSKFHSDMAEAGGTLFTAGIEFLTLETSYRGHILDCLLKLFWEEYLFGHGEIQKLLNDIKNLPLEERRIALQNYNFCQLFADGGCPNQKMMERAYLIPQVLSGNDLIKTQNTCWSCRMYKHRRIYYDESA
jgi:hypothetical protein